jgi:hypothetical protein
VQLNYESSKHLKGKMIRYRNKNGEWVVGKVLNVKKNGLEIADLDTSDPFFIPFAFFFFDPFFIPFAFFFFDPFFFFF